MLFIIGSGHHYQFGAGACFGGYRCSNEDEHAFATMLRHEATSLRAEALAEEMNLQALEERGKQTSVVQSVAAELSLQHIFCEPDRCERWTLGIFDENEIRISAFPETLAEEVLREREAQSWRRREEEWLRRLDKVKQKRTLFVCGAKHIETFVPLAEASGIACRILHVAWEAQPSAQPAVQSRSSPAAARRLAPR